MAKKKRSGNRMLYILGGLVVVLILFAIIGNFVGIVGQKKKTEVEVANAEKDTIIEKVSASGQVQPVVEVQLSPEVSGEIIELNVEEGDSVSKGNRLLRIRPDNFKSALDQAEAGLNQQKAALAQAKAARARAKANLTRLEQDFLRQQKLFKEKVISEADFQLATTNYQIAEQDYESAKESVNAANYSLKSAEARVADASENLRLTILTAPMSGIVSKLPVELGETVLGTSQFQGTEVMRIADLSKMEVKVDVNENDIIKISVGDTSIIDVDSYAYLDKTFKGVVTNIANTANDKISSDAVTEFEVRIQILNSSYRDLIKEEGLKYPFRPGMTASVDIITEVRKNILTVPLSAVTTRSSEKRGEDDTENLPDEDLKEVVFVMEEGKAVQKEVTTGISDFEIIEILTGIEEGTKVISGPFLAVSKRLKNGDDIKLNNKEQKENDPE
ncbi:MAG: efflux RND transporter periplasmic adaptor subunit [Ekhidna sp.]|nr:efflux RND transporter periplasmic adaptor subunit [Ekhidna sp.]MBC6410435.1 efflux RND transporter periplasmic adaptor subunit [Ekhidna sp.]